MSGPLADPPGPRGLPLVGVLPQFRKDPAGFLLQVAQNYGELSSFRLGQQQIYLVNRPDLIEEILVTSQGNFIKSRMLQRAKTLLGEGLLTSEGVHHTRQRKLVQPAFYKDRLASYAATMVSTAERTQRRWRDGETLDLAQEMMGLTLAIVGLTLFSRDVESDAEDIGKALSDVIGSFNTMLLPFADLIRHLPFGAMRRTKRAQQVLDERIYGIVRERRAEGTDRGDLLSTLLLAAEDGTGAISDKQVRDETMTLMLAGHETTANALTWTWYLLSQNPVAEQRVREEWSSVLGGRMPRYEDLPALEYTERVLAESLRLFPPAWSVGRMAINQFRLFNTMIPAGAICILSPYVMHRNPRFWAEPGRFDPERFIPEAKASRPKFSYFPFGGGPRLCIGERFAWTEGVLLLATIGQRWRFQLDSGQRVDIHPEITLRPRYGMRMTADRVVA